MNGHLHIIFSPLLPMEALQLLCGLAICLVIYALYKRSKGSVGRAVTFALLTLIFFNPSLIAEQREPLKDTALLVIDDSASMKLGKRGEQAAHVLESLQKKLAAFPDLEVETLHVKGSHESNLLRALEQKLGAIPRDRLAGIIAITDGQIHDKNETEINAPLHALIAGNHNETDRRIVIKQAPAYGLVGSTVELTLRIDDEPKAQSDTATVTFQPDKGQSQTVTMPVGKDIPFQVPIEHAGENLFAFSTPPLPNELTPINNAVAVSVNGIRDRLRVLLVSGQPHIGGRTWRNFLKADPAVDLIHFTILRSPMKADNIPNNELSLIAFPVHELFEIKLQSFDLVIFDRFRQQSLVPDAYLENIADYVENGGSLLISSSTDVDVPPLDVSPLARVLPTQPTGKLLTGGFRPDLTLPGQRHPVTSSLTTITPRDKWGHWFREIGARSLKGEVLMSGINNQPLLVLDHVGQGRVAQFLSDQFWLWSHGFEGGGPQAELLRRIVHWLVQEPELDETALRAHGEIVDDGWQLSITKQSLRDDSLQIQVIDPENTSQTVTLTPSKQPGVLAATLPVSMTGLYRLKDGDNEILAMVGPTDAPEFGDMRATDEKIKTAVKASNGAINWLIDHADGPEIKRTAPNATQQGWNWIGLKQNGQFRVTGSKAYPLLPAWLWISALLITAMLTWRREGK
ncbi:MAG: hypothetical protein WAO98_01960 [Alphaproteobacteria bacterium]